MKKKRSGWHPLKPKFIPFEAYLLNTLIPVIEIELSIATRMSINHSNHKSLFSTYLIPSSAATFWANNTTSAAAGVMFCSQTAAVRFNLNNEELPEHPVTDRGTNSTQLIEQEKLFEKPLTPSDVGKLNRLVIPKQHAEKYFPLNGGAAAAAADSGEKGLLLGFEDEGGKPWRFRYSYWNSSQSYVLTKGWSRFVKEKRLDAGDVVLFARHPKDFGRFFIGWRRRDVGGVPAVGGGRWSGVVYSGHPYPNQHQVSPSVAYQTDQYCSTTAAEKSSITGGGVHVCVAEEQTRRSGNSKRLRLFGVNLEWPEDEPEASTSTAAEGSATSSQGESTQHQFYTDHHRTC
ncbi:hypothetical protein ACS0TY_016607 [Phlomoides rotata]